MYNDFLGFKRFQYDWSSNVPHFLQELESEECPRTSEMTLYEENVTELKECMDFLYHGIRFQNYLEKLEGIFKEKAILAGKYVDGYHSYGDNCNFGEYVSLLFWQGIDTIEYEKFIIPNISLVVSPECDATLAYYVDFTIWVDIKKAKEEKSLELKNLYSYMRGECLVKDRVPLDMIKAVGVPYYYLSIKESPEYAEKILNDVRELMNKYEIELPIVDTSRFNASLDQHGIVKTKKI